MGNTRIGLGIAGCVAILALAACSSATGGAAGGDGGGTQSGTQASTVQQSTGSDSAGKSASGTAAVLPGGKLTIALAAPLSGPSAASGAQMKNGCTLAVDQYNDANPNGPRVALDVQDDASNPATGVNLVAKFQQEGAVAIVGGYNSPVALAMQSKVEEAQIPFLAQGIASAINGAWVYHSVPVGPVQAEGTAKFLADHGAKSIGILTDTSSFGTSALPDIKKAVESAGLKVAGEATFDVDSSNVAPQIIKIKSSGADGIILYTTGEPIARAMIGMHQAGVALPVVSNFTAADPAVARIAASSANGLVFESIVDPNKTAVKNLSAEYAKKFPGSDAAPVYAVVTYDQCNVVLAGIKNGAITGSEMHKFLDGFQSDKLASGTEGSVLKYSSSDHTGWGADALVYQVYRDSKVVPCSDPSAKCGTN